MDELMEKLQKVLEDEESMNQIKQLAEMFAKESSAKQSSPPQNNENPASDAIDFSKLFSSFSQNDKDKSADSQEMPDDIDFSKILKLTSLMSQVKKTDKNTELLIALKPLLKDENQNKVDRIVKIFRLMAMWPVIKESGLLTDEFGKF